jgi:hypothetical protein
MFLSCSLQDFGFCRMEEWLPSLFVKVSIADYFLNFVLLIVARANSNSGNLNFCRLRGTKF